LKVTINVVATDQKPATCVVELVSGPTAPGDIDDFELQHARRVLAQLKAAIGRQGLMELLRPDIKLGVDFLSEMAVRSDGELKPATTVLAVRGLQITEFLHWLDRQFDTEAVMLAAEPDHFVIAPNEDGRVTIVETLGEYVCQIHLPPYDGAATWDEAVVNELLPESEYQFRRIARITLPDGTLVGRMVTQYGDTPEGFNVSLTAYFPIACPEDVFEHHRQHLAVEFRNWIMAAASENRQ
jgi:uncharacterized protein